MNNHGNYNAYKSYSYLGTLFLIIGWIFIITLVSLQPSTNETNSIQVLSFDSNQFLSLGIPTIFLMILYLLLQKVQRLYLFVFVFYVLTWFYFAYQIDRLNKNQYFSYIGAIFILLSEIILSKRIGHKVTVIFNPGIPLFIFGWIFIMIAVSNTY